MGANNPKTFSPPMAQGQATNAYQTLNQSQAPQQLATPYLAPYDMNVNQGMMPFVQSPNSVRLADPLMGGRPGGQGYTSDETSRNKYNAALIPGMLLGVKQ
jgi:hypothetical protein